MKNESPQTDFIVGHCPSRIDSLTETSNGHRPTCCEFNRCPTVRGKIGGHTVHPLPPVPSKTTAEPLVRVLEPQDFSRPPPRDFSPRALQRTAAGLASASRLCGGIGGRAVDFSSARATLEERAPSFVTAQSTALSGGRGGGARGRPRPIFQGPRAGQLRNRTLAPRVWERIREPTRPAEAMRGSRELRWASGSLVVDFSFAFFPKWHRCWKGSFRWESVLYEWRRARLVVGDVRLRGAAFRCGLVDRGMDTSSSGAWQLQSLRESMFGTRWVCKL